MAGIIGQQITRFWFGEKFVFKRVTKGEWECVSGQQIIPADMISDLPD